VRGLDWREFWTTVRTARLSWLIPAVLIGQSSLFLRSLRWRILLRAEKDVSPLTVFWATMAGYLGNNFLPARAGEVIRSVALGRRAGMNKTWVFATAVTERLLDAVALVLLSLVAVLLLGHSSAWLFRAWRIAGLIAIAGVVIFVFLLRSEGLVRRLVERLPGPAGVRLRLLDVLANFLSGLRALGRPSRAAGFAGLTVIIWFMDAFGSMVGARAFGLELTLPAALVLLAGLGLSSAVPSTPGYVGVYQFVAVTVLVPLGYARSGALAYITVSQGIGYVAFTVWGLLGLWRLQVRPRAVLAERNRE